MAGMTDEELLSLLKTEEANASSFYNSELADDQAKALDHYHAKPYGDEVKGRSSVVSHDVEDAINWIMPDLMRVFMGADQILSLDGATEEDEQLGRTQQAADYMEHIFRRDNDGETVLHDFAFDGLLQRIGFMSIAWEDPKPKAPKLLEGVSPENLVKYTTDAEYEILEQEEDPETGLFRLKVRHKPRMGRVCIEGVPSEEMAWSKAARSLETARYHRRKRQKPMSELRSMFPALKDYDEDGASKQDDDPETDARFIARFSDENSNTTDANSKQKMGTLYEEFVRCDFDGDGFEELRSVKRVGNVICENVMVDASDFVDWTPIRVAHKMAGRSLDDVLKDIQKIKTVLTRRLLDGLAQSLTPRKAVNTMMVEEEGVGDLLDNDIGGVVRVNGDWRAAIGELTTPDTSASALQAIEHMDGRAEEASGVTRHSQGLDPQALNKTASGIDLLQAAAKSRTELVARWLAKGLERVFARILHLVCAHQDAPRQVKIKGQWVDIDPRGWSDEMGVTVHVAMAAASRAAQVSNLSVVATKQEAILQTAGPSNPIVTLVQYRNTLAKMVEAMGFKDAGQFFAEIPEGYQPPEPQQQQDPKILAVQAQIEAAKLKAQADQQAREAELVQKRELAAMEGQQAHELAMQKMANEFELAQIKLRAEQQAAADRTAAEMALARWKAEQEVELAREQGARRDMMQLNGSGQRETLGHPVRMGGKVG